MSMPIDSLVPRACQRLGMAGWVIAGLGLTGEAVLVLRLRHLRDPREQVGEDTLTPGELVQILGRQRG